MMVRRTNSAGDGGVNWFEPTRGMKNRRRRKPHLEPLLALLPPYWTINKFGLWERKGRRDGKAAEHRRPWGTGGPEGADHPPVVARPPGIPVGDRYHPHDPSVSRTGQHSAALHTHALRHSEDGSGAEEEGRSEENWEYRPRDPRPTAWGKQQQAQALSLAFWGSVFLEVTRKKSAESQNY